MNIHSTTSLYRTDRIFRFPFDGRTFVIFFLGTFVYFYFIDLSSDEVRSPRPCEHVFGAHQSHLPKMTPTLPYHGVCTANRLTPE